MTGTTAGSAKAVMGMKDAAAYLGCSKVTLYRKVSEGHVPGFKLGNQWRFRRELLDRWMDKESMKGMVSAR